ncbi:MAG: trimethylamine methyltransferase family protein [Actinobacteria bacterium]|nr:trimethylamine methyltransferase family protein [Actinomycetota bacterium]
MRHGRRRADGSIGRRAGTRDGRTLSGVGAVFRPISWPIETHAPLTPHELIHAFGLPAFGGAGGTDCPRADGWQAGVEEALGVCTGLFTKAEMSAGIGLRATCQLSTPESLVLDSEIYRSFADLLRDENVSDESLALDTIDQVGPGGHFLAARHTRKHLRDSVRLGMCHLPAHDGPAYRDPLEVARERADEILGEYEPRRLPPDLRAELAGIVAALDADVQG